MSPAIVLVLVQACGNGQKQPEPCEESCSAFIECVSAPGGGAEACALEHACEHSPCETWAAAEDRKVLVEARRNANPIFVHRGATEVAAENTLEAHQATFELGAEGNEVDVNRTSDGVLVAFHDPFPSWQLEALVDWSSVDWQRPEPATGYLLLSQMTLLDLQQVPFRFPQSAGIYARVPTIAEVLVVHLRHAGLLHLDIKDAGVHDQLVALLDVLDLWEHVTRINGQAEVVERLVTNPAYRPGGQQLNAKEDRADLDLVAMQEFTSTLEASEALFVGDPSMALHARGNVPGAAALTPVRKTWPALMPIASASQSAVVNWLQNSLDDSAYEPGTDASRQAMLARAAAALTLAKQGSGAQDVLAALDALLHQRTLDPDWRFHSIDGAEALYAWLELTGGTDCGEAWCDAAPRVTFAMSLTPQTLPPPQGFPPASDWRMQMGLWAYLAKGTSPQQRQARGDLVQGYLDNLESLEVEPFEIIVEEIIKARLALLPIDDETASHDAASSIAKSLLDHPNLSVQRRSSAELRKRAPKESWAEVALSQ